MSLAYLLPPDLATEVVGSESLPPNGEFERERLYLRGCHPDISHYGENVQVIPEDKTLSHQVETSVEVTRFPPEVFW